MKNTAFYHMNLMQNEAKEHMAAQLVTLQSTLLEALENKENENPQVNQALVAQSDVQQKILKTLQSLSDRMDKFECKQVDKRNTNTQNIDWNIPPWKRPGCKSKYYCWTCGRNNNHDSKNHTGPKKDGHKDEATFENRMGGSTYNISKKWQ